MNAKRQRELWHVQGKSEAAVRASVEAIRSKQTTIFDRLDFVRSAE